MFFSVIAVIILWIMFIFPLSTWPQGHSTYKLCCSDTLYCSPFFHHFNIIFHSYQILHIPPLSFLPFFCNPTFLLLFPFPVHSITILSLFLCPLFLAKYSSSGTASSGHLALSTCIPAGTSSTGRNASESISPQIWRKSSLSL